MSELFRLVSVLRDRLPTFPRELLPIVAEYGIDRQHEWSNSKTSTSLTIDRNRLTCIGNADQPTMNWPWYFIVSDLSVQDGSAAWTIDCQLAEDGWICAGITNDETTGVRERPGTKWTDATTETDFLVATYMTGEFDDDVSTICGTVLTDITSSLKNAYPKKRLKPNKPTAVSFESDFRHRQLRIRFEDGNGQQRTVLLDLPEPFRRHTGVWRPAVAVCGFASATIRSLSDAF